jgi:hypothetical protein
MKLFSTFLILLFSVTISFSQDYIYKKDGEKIASTVVSVENGFIRYKLFRSRDNAVKQISVNEVSMIDYQGKGIEFIKDFLNQPNTEKSQNSTVINRDEFSQNSSQGKFDLIIKNNGENIDAIIVEIFPETVKYRFSYQPDGPIRNIPVSNISKVIYSNGEEKKFNNQKQFNEGNHYSNNKVSDEQEYVEKTNLEEEYNLAIDPFTSIRLGAGYGNSYGGAGLKAQVLFGANNFRIGIHGGAGYYFEELDINSEKVLCYSAGLQFYFWKGLNLDLQYGGFGIYKQYNKTSIMLEGPSGLIGYEHKIAKNILIDISGGTCYDLNGKNKLWVAYDAGISFLF